MGSPGGVKFTYSFSLITGLDDEQRYGQDCLTVISASVGRFTWTSPVAMPLAADGEMGIRAECRYNRKGRVCAWYVEEAFHTASRLMIH
jgi:hypothetical protein